MHHEQIPNTQAFRDLVQAEPGRQYVYTVIGGLVQTCVIAGPDSVTINGTALTVDALLGMANLYGGQTVALNEVRQLGVRCRARV